jgi:hypothetical protein
VNTVMNLSVPEKAGKFLISCVIVTFSRRSLLHGINLFVCLYDFYCTSCELLIVCMTCRWMVLTYLNHQ